jgi:putative transcriptional regulator
MGTMAAQSEKNNYLAGRILLAMPAMGDPRFHRAVIFICAHDANGAMGLVINHRLPGLELSQLLQQMKIKAEDDAPGKPLADSLPVMSGGPVESARGFILHSPDFAQADTIKVNDDFSVTGTVDALRAVAGGNGPQRMLFILGYAGWTAGQLDQEIQDNAWLVADADPDVVFGAPPDEKWDRTIKMLGINPAMLSGDAGRA